MLIIGPARQRTHNLLQNGVSAPGGCFPILVVAIRLMSGGRFDNKNKRVSTADFIYLPKDRFLLKCYFDYMM